MRSTKCHLAMEPGVGLRAARLFRGRACSRLLRSEMAEFFERRARQRVEVWRAFLERFDQTVSDDALAPELSLAAVEMKRIVRRRHSGGERSRFAPLSAPAVGSDGCLPHFESEKEK